VKELAKHTSEATEQIIAQTAAMRTTAERTQKLVADIGELLHQMGGHSEA